MQGSRSVDGRDGLLLEPGGHPGVLCAVGIVGRRCGDGGEHGEEFLHLRFPFVTWEE